MTPEERIAALEAENARPREQVTVVLARVQALEARLATDSHNGGKPPSSDGLARKTKRPRRRSGKRPGGQPGHRGETLRLVATADELVEHRPTVCGACGADLAVASLVVCERRHVHELPALRLRSTAHRRLQLRGPACARVSAGTLPAVAASRAQYGPRRLRALAAYLVEQQLVPDGRARALLADLFGARRARLARDAGGAGGPAGRSRAGASGGAAQGRARAGPRAAESDESGVRQAGHLPRPGACGEHASADPRRRACQAGRRGHRGQRHPAAVDGRQRPRRLGRPAIGRTPAAATRWATAITCASSPSWTSSITFLDEQYHQRWARELKALLLEMKATVEQTRAAGRRQLPIARRAALVARYQALLASGHAAAHPPPESRPRQRGRIKQPPARHLLERLWLGQDRVLAFLDDLRIPVDGDDQAERDRRRRQVQQKVSGSFRSVAGAEAVSRLRGYWSTPNKQGAALLAALETLFTGQPLYPSVA